MDNEEHNLTNSAANRRNKIAEAEHRYATESAKEIDMNTKGVNFVYNIAGIKVECTAFFTNNGVTPSPNMGTGGSMVSPDDGKWCLEDLEIEYNGESIYDEVAELYVKNIMGKFELVLDDIRDKAYEQ